MKVFATVCLPVYITEDMIEELFGPISEFNNLSIEQQKDILCEIAEQDFSSTWVITECQNSELID